MISAFRTAAAAILATALTAGAALAASEHAGPGHDAEIGAAQAGTDRGNCQGMGMGRMSGKEHRRMGGGGMMGGTMGDMGGGATADKKLTADDAKAIVAGRLAFSGNKRVKVGKATEKDAETVAVEVVTVDNSLVQTVEIDRRTGRPKRPVQAN